MANWNIKDKVVLITGANSGIGKATALELAKKGSIVVMVCRNRQKGEAAKTEVIAKSGNNRTDLMIADMGSQDSIRELAASFKRKYAQLHILINNAGSVFNPRQVTKDGIESTFAVNHLGPFLLTNLLLENLKAGAPSRIVNLSSGLHPKGRINFDDLMMEKKYNGFSAYNNSKLANVLFTYELARKLKGTGIDTNVVHPGIVRSNLGRGDSKFPWYSALFWVVYLPFMVSPEKGAETSVYLASSPEVEGVSGKYFIRKKEARSSKKSYDMSLAQNLWNVSARLTSLDH